MDFSERLKELRTEKDIGQKDLAKILNVTYATISKYERGQTQPDIEGLINLAKFFNCTCDYLLGISDIRNCTDCQSHKKPDELSDREKSLIEMYRQLPPDEQLVLYGEIKGIVRTYKQVTPASEEERKTCKVIYFDFRKGGRQK